MDKNKKSEVPGVAGRSFYNGDYQKKDPVSSGLATTHEQVSDTYAEGTIDAEAEPEE